MAKSANSPAAALLREHGTRVEQYLHSVRGRFLAAPARLWDAIDYSVLGGGKRLRPALVLECFRACDGKAAQEASALAASAAVELVHGFSLVHDDLPAMDDDDLRRGKPTNHKVFGEALAILSGDAMLALAFEIIATDAAPPLIPPLIIELAHSTGSEGMIGGQVRDIESQNQALPLTQLKELHRMKTGALLTAACRIGAICANATIELLDALTSFGEHIGLAFQIMDDLLDATSTAEQLGKKTRKDVGRGKNTYPALLGIDDSRLELAAQLASALDALAPLGSSADRLRALARFVAERQS